MVCCFCGNDEDFVPKDEVMEEMNVTKKTPLPICRDCFRRKIFPPVVNAVTNFAEVAEMERSRKKKRLETAVSQGLRKSRKKSKGI